MAIKRLQISLPTDLVDKLDKCADDFYLKRSQLIRDALQMYLHNVAAKRLKMQKVASELNFDDAEQLAWSIIRRNRRVLAHRNLHKDKLCHCGKIEKPSLAQITTVRYNRPR